MKTILSLVAAIALAGILPLALAEPKAGRSNTKAAPKAIATVTNKAEVKALPKIEKQTEDKPAIKLPLTTVQETKLLALLNEGSTEELSAIPGIADTRADSIRTARPFASVHEVILVEGVGRATFEKILAHGKTLTLTRSTSRKS